MDETSISRTPTVVRTWAPVGETPDLTLPQASAKERISALAMLTSAGSVFLDAMPGSFTGARVLVNLVALFETLPGRIVVLLDNASIHGTRKIKEWLARPEVAARLEAVRFPSYAPDLNPVELLNSASKRRGLGNFAAESLEALAARFREAFKSPPETVKAYFRGALGTDFSACQKNA